MLRIAYRGHKIEITEYPDRQPRVEMTIYYGYTSRQYVRQAYLFDEQEAVNQAKHFIDDKINTERGRLMDQIWRIEEEWYGKQRGTVPWL